MYCIAICRLSCIGIVLVLYWICIAVVLVLALVLFWCCSGLALVVYWYGVDLVLVSSLYGLGTELELNLYCIGVCNGFGSGGGYVWALCCYCIDIGLVLCCFFYLVLYGYCFGIAYWIVGLASMVY